MAVQAPSVLAQLPKPLEISEGQTQFAPVLGHVGSRKRKRHEIAVAVDGETVNLYNVSLSPVGSITPSNLFRRCSRGN